MLLLHFFAISSFVFYIIVKFMLSLEPENFSEVNT